MRSNVAPCLAKRSAKKTRTAWPKMTGSLTFIIVAFICNEKSTPLLRASSTWACKNAISARLLITVPSKISPGSSFRPPLSTVTVPSAATCSIRTVVAAETVTDRSLW